MGLGAATNRNHPMASNAAEGMAIARAPSKPLVATRDVSQALLPRPTNAQPRGSTRWNVQAWPINNPPAITIMNEAWRASTGIHWETSDWAKPRPSTPTAHASRNTASRHGGETAGAAAEGVDRSQGR